MVRNSIEHYVKQSCEKAGFEYPKATSLYHPEQSLGDFASNVALILSKKEKKPPKEIAEIIKEHLVKASHKEIETVDVSESGFINIFIKTTTLKEIAARAIKDETFGRHSTLKGKK